MLTEKLLCVTKLTMELMQPRWKGKGFADIAAVNPMSQIILQLQCSLTRLKVRGMLSECNVLLEVVEEIADLLDRACFGRQINVYDNNKKWFQLGLEEAFYMNYHLECLPIVSSNGNTVMSAVKLWEHMKSNNSVFPQLYKAYSHLRMKNWVVRSGTQYGVDFVAYRHHPALVHSEYAVIVIVEGSDNSRLWLWSDLHCSVRVSGSVAKTLLILSICQCGADDGLLSLDKFTVDERVIRRWIPEHSREEKLSEG